MIYRTNSSLTAIDKVYANLQSRKCDISVWYLILTYKQPPNEIGAFSISVLVSWRQLNS